MNVQLTDKKEAIFQSTLQLLQEYGFHGTPMSQIAKQAQVSVGTIYHYFESKDALIIELYVHCKTRLKAYLFSDIASTCYEQQFKIVWKRFISFYTTHPTYFRFLEQFYSSPFHEAVRFRKIPIRSDVGGISGFLQDGIRAGKLRTMEPQLLCSAYTGVAVSFVKAILFGKVAFEQEQLDQMVEVVWRSIKA